MALLTLQLVSLVFHLTQSFGHILPTANNLTWIQCSRELLIGPVVLVISLTGHNAS